jgi:FMN phosphatase YigB (HAD superfamily)
MDMAQRPPSAPEHVSDSGRQTGALFLVVLDFDQTLAVSEISFFEASSGDVRVEVFGGVPRHDLLSRFLLELSSRGASLAIVSYNSAVLIRQILRAVGWEAHFGDRVYGRDEVHRYNHSKSACIKHELMQPLRIVSADTIFVDDDAHNCRAVMQLGVRAVHINHPGGMGEKEMGAVMEWVDARVRAVHRKSSFSSAIGSLRQSVADRLKRTGDARGNSHNLPV